MLIQSVCQCFRIVKQIESNFNRENPFHWFAKTGKKHAAYLTIPTIEYSTSASASQEDGTN